MARQGNSNPERPGPSHASRRFSCSHPRTRAAATHVAPWNAHGAVRQATRVDNTQGCMRAWHVHVGSQAANNASTTQLHITHFTQGQGPSQARAGWMGHVGAPEVAVRNHTTRGACYAMTVQYIARRQEGQDAQTKPQKPQDVCVTDAPAMDLYRSPPSRSVPIQTWQLPT